MATLASQRRKNRRLGKITTTEGVVYENDPNSSLPGAVRPTGERTSGDGPFVPPGFQGGGSSGVSALPFRGEFPAFPTVKFPTIDKADYDKTDVIDFARKFGEFNRGELDKNFDQASKFSLRALDTELSGLNAFAPAASALSREQSSIDNYVNQARREAQVDSALPDARGTFADIGKTLKAQARRADRYASGRLNSDIEDRALELNARARAAAISNAGGIGPLSGQASKLSDLMSAETRFGIAQYGEGLTTQNVAGQQQNIREQANLFLAPTVYSDTGRQIRPTPEVGAGRLTYQGFGSINEASLTSPGQALSSEIQQEQFDTQLEQRTNEFNATGKFSASTFNSQGIFQSKVGQFQADAQYASALQAANQGNLNFAGALEFQGLSNQGYFGGLQQGQDSQTLPAVAQGLGTVAGAAGGIGSILSSGGSDDSPGLSNDGVDSSPIDTSPSDAPTVEIPEIDSGSIDSGVTARTAAPAGGSIEASSPSTYRLERGVPTSEGFSPVSRNSDGSTTVVRSADYASDLDRFAKFTGNDSGGSIRVGDAASMDRAISSAAGLAYVPIQGFQPVAANASGRMVYTDPGMAASANTSLGAGRVEASMLAAAQLGITDPAMYAAMTTAGSVASDPRAHASLDEAYLEGGESAVGGQLLGMVAGGADLSTDAGKKLSFGAMRIGELWPNLSPAQRSLAVSSLTNSAVEAKTGKNPAKQTVPGSEGAVTGPLTVGDAVSITAEGANGFSLARNWSQLSAVGSMLGATSSRGVAGVADKAGFLGFGPQGSAVNIDPGYLQQVGARPAPEMGIGAAVFGTPTQVPRDYKVLSEVPGGVLAIPKTLAGTSTATSGGPGPLAFRKAQEVASGTHPIQKSWKGKPATNAIRGSAGGSAIISGLSTLIDANPALAGSISAYSLMRNSMGM